MTTAIELSAPNEPTTNFESARVPGRYRGRRPTLHTAFGLTKTVHQWAEALNISYGTLSTRIFKASNALDALPVDAISIPKAILLECVIRGMIDHLVDHKRDPKTHQEWEAHLGIPPGSLGDNHPRWV